MGRCAESQIVPEGDNITALIDNYAIIEKVREFRIPIGHGTLSFTEAQRL